MAWIWPKRDKAVQEGPSRDNTWHRYNSANDTVIVFVHGLMSSADTCWTAKTGAFWPHHVSHDETFDEVNIFLGAYHTSLGSGQYDIAQCARGLHDELRSPQGGKRAVLQHRNIIFLCHSLGGIVCRRLIEEYQYSFEGKVIGLLLYASPSLGSEWAKSFAMIARVYKHEVTLQLLPDSSALRDIDDRFRDVLKNGKLQIIGAEAVEHWGPARVSWLPEFLKPIVSASSSSRYFGATRQIPKTDHFNIVKPESADSESHKFLRNYFLTEFLTKVPKESANDSVKELSQRAIKIHQSALELALFDVYTPQSSIYYIDRDVDTKISESIKLRSVWLIGKSGVGKTSISRRYIDKNQIMPVEISLSQLGSEASQDELANEIANAISQNGSATNGSLLNAAVDTVCTICINTPIPLFIDEVPINTERVSHIVDAIGIVLERVKRKAGAGVRFLVCSINSPIHPSINGRFREAFSVIEVPDWRDDDIRRLIAVIETTCSRKLADSDALLLVDAAKGSPRFVKTFYRNMNTHFEDDVRIDDIIDLTRRDLRGL